MKCSDFYSKVMLQATTPYVRVGVWPVKTYFARNNMKCSDLYSKFMLPTSTPMGVAVVGGWLVKLKKKLLGIV